MGLWSDTETLWLAAGFQVWRMENMLDEVAARAGYDRLYVPQMSFTTGDVDIHDVVCDSQGEPYFVSSLFCCIAQVDQRDSFRPVWRPPFVSDLVPEDRCHLNGLGRLDGKPRFATVCGETNVDHGWRAAKRDGGCVIDIESNTVLVRGLSMPHSPRHYAGKLWVLNSGRGQLGFVDMAAGVFEPVAFCQGFARGLAFIGKYAIVGISKPRNSVFKGIELDEELERHGVQAFCGLSVIDVEQGEEVHRVSIEGKVDELYDVVALPGVRRPRALGLKSEEIQRNVWFVDDGKRLRFTARDGT